MVRNLLSVATLAVFGCSQSTQPPGQEGKQGLTSKASVKGQMLPSVQVKEAFSITPYVQLGETPSPTSLAVCWVATDGAWAAKVVGGHEAKVTSQAMPGGKTLYSAHLTWAGEQPRVPYSVTKDGKEVWNDAFIRLKGPKESAKMIFFGDCGAGTRDQATIAKLAAAQQPDMIVIPGDIVYKHGRLSEYADNFWPYYNGDTGVRIMDNTLFVGALGNHDIYASGDANDDLGFFRYWSAPLNGPALTDNGLLKSAPKGFGEATGGRFPKMGNYSFDEGPVHITVLDSNTYSDYGSEPLAGWLKADLHASKQPWKVVTFHHPPFHTSNQHQMDRSMRRAVHIFEEEGVNLVIAGHVHNYQRTKSMVYQGDDKFAYDEVFDGVKYTRAKHPIYLVEGSGGNVLYDIGLQDRPADWQPYMLKYIAHFGLGVLDASKDRLVYRHLTADGKEADHFEITR